MKSIFQMAMFIIIALGTTACLTDQLAGDITAESSEGSFNALVSTGILIQENDIQSKNLTLTGTNGTKILTISISEIGGDTTNTCLSVGTYESSNATNNAQLIYASGTATYTEVIDCTIEISDCNTDESAISGTFRGTLASTSGDTITFSSGSFEDVVFQN